MTIHSLLTPENSTVIFIDQQLQMTFGVASIDRLVKQHSGAYDSGVEYAYIMIHKKAPTIAHV